jgi:hypothetical protein
MKFQKLVLAGLMAAVLGIVGCSKQGAVDVTPLEKSFQTAQGAAKTAADTAIAAIRKADYSGAMSELQKLAKDASLTPEQQQAIKDVVAQIQKVLADTASKAAGDANKAVNDMQKSLPK